MKLRFHKYHGTGNDFIMVDDRGLDFPANTQEIVPQLCHRRFGIGADGVILLQDHPQYDFHMVYYNSDGRPSSMCGNGGRCLVAFAKDLGLITDRCSFLAVDGMHEANVEHDMVSLKMGDVQPPRQWQDMWLLDTGSPHLIRYMSSGEEVEVEREGRELRNHPDFGADGVNINFVWMKGDNNLMVRTYERGVEAETWSCGTGVTAAAIATGNLYGSSHFKVQTLGGKLEVRFSAGEVFTDVYLAGPAVAVYSGEVDLSVMINK